MLRFVEDLLSRLDRRALQQPAGQLTEEAVGAEDVALGDAAAQELADRVVGELVPDPAGQPLGLQIDRAAPRAL